jgi:hypothetical protein
MRSLRSFPSGITYENAAPSHLGDICKEEPCQGASSTWSSVVPIAPVARDDEEGSERHRDQRCREERCFFNASAAIRGWGLRFSSLGAMRPADRVA